MMSEEQCHVPGPFCSIIRAAPPPAQWSRGPPRIGYGPPFSVFRDWVIGVK
ncbi:hypothetical protein L537_3999 [Bordetella hinzii 1277]|nr:hypothetical protein L538_3960 [Bordetella hinzii 4161]KCB50478.1 hypothetical protein L537_3999 [Bordetella hinzii 1277]